MSISSLPSCLKSLRLIVIAGALAFITSYSTLSQAAQGCGFGYHRTGYGGCALNYPGPYARPAPMHPGCWRNRFGYLRCYR